MMPPLAERYTAKEDIICYDSPVLILVCAEKDPQWSTMNLIDSALAAQNMFLRAYELGLGTCYMGFVSLLNSKPDILKKIGVPENCDLMVPFILGHPKPNKGDLKERSRIS